MTNFLTLIFFAMFKQVFLFTRFAYFLSIIPSFSLGYISNNFFDIINPKTLFFHYYFDYQNFYELGTVLEDQNLENYNL